MKNAAFLFVFILSVSNVFAARIPNQMGVDWRTQGPKGQNWVKVTDIHSLDKNSIKRVKGAMYQGKLCNSLKLPNGNTVWNYFDSRVDCKTRQAYTQGADKKWMGPMNPTDYDEAVMKYACK